MSVIVLAEHDGGSFKKKTFEAVQYAAGIAEKTAGVVVSKGTRRPRNERHGPGTISFVRLRAEP